MTNQIDKIYIIHYTKLKERYEIIKKQVEKLKIPFEFINDFDREQLNNASLNYFYSPDKDKFDHKVSSLWNSKTSPFRHLNEPEISCTIKHLIAWKKISEECENYGMILEDDVLFNDSFEEKYKKYINQTPNDWDVIFIGEGCGVDFQKYKIFNHSDKINENCFLIGHPATNCAEAYIIKPKIAEKIYKLAIPFQLVSDWEMAYQLYKINAKVYWWYPSLVTQGSKNGKYKSTLDLGQRQ